MTQDAGFETVDKIRAELTAQFREDIEKSISTLKAELDKEIDREIRERIAVLRFDELVNDMPMVPYLAIWEDGGSDIMHAYMSPKIETLCGYEPRELQEIGYISIVRGDIISFYQDEDGVEEKTNPISVAKEKRVTGFLGNRNWEGCYMIEKKSGQLVWVIDRSTITRFRNTLNGTVICLSNGILLESTELLLRRERCV